MVYFPVKFHTQQLAAYFSLHHPMKAALLHKMASATICHRQNDARCLCF